VEDVEVSSRLSHALSAPLVTFAALLVFGGHFSLLFLAGVGGDAGVVTPPLPSPTSLSAVAVTALLLIVVGRERGRHLPWAPADRSRMTTDFCWCFGKGWGRGTG
jgi:hypothetical protein